MPPWQKNNLDGLLMFQQESMYYLTGYDTFGFCFFQCLYLGVDGKLALLTRSADLRQAQHTSIIEDIRIWTDQAGAQPATQLRDMLDSLGARGKRLGIETNSYGLTHFNGKAVDGALDGFCTLTESTNLVNLLRLTKSPAELKYVRKAGALGDEALKAASRKTKAGADEGDILAAQHSAIFSGGGDYPGNEFIIGSSRDALLCRYKSGRRKLSKRDQRDAGVRRGLSPLPRGLHAHADHWEVDRSTTSPWMRSAARRSQKLKVPCVRARPRVMCSILMPESWMLMACRSTGSMPAAIRWVRSSRRAGWIIPCSIAAMRLNSGKAWCSSPT